MAGLNPNSSLPDRLHLIETVEEDSELETLADKLSKMRTSQSEDSYLVNGGIVTGVNGNGHLVSPGPSPGGSPRKIPPAIPVKYHRMQKHRPSSHQENNNEKTFFVNENGKTPRWQDKDRTLRFVGRRGLAEGDGEDIHSMRGTVRGVKNRVRAGIANYEYKPLDYNRVSYRFYRWVCANSLVCGVPHLALYTSPEVKNTKRSDSLHVHE